MLQADRSTVLRWANTGRLKFEKLPGRTGAFLFRRGDVEEFAAQLPSREGSQATCSCGTSA